MKKALYIEETLTSEGASIGGATIFDRGRTKKEGTHAHIKVNANLEEALTFGEGPCLIWRKR